MAAAPLKVPRRLFEYAVAFVAVAAATVARRALVPLLDSTTPFITYFPAIVFVVWTTRTTGPSVFALLFSALAAAYYFVPPANSLLVTGRAELVGLAIFLFVGGALVAIGRAMRRAEAEAARRAETLRVTLSSIGDAVIATDTEGRVTSLNPVAEGLTGWTDAAAHGRPLEEVFDIVHEETGATVASPVRRVLAEGVVVGLANHTILRARDGRSTPIDDSAAPILGDDGAILGVVLVFRDVGVQRAADRRLIESTAELIEADRRKTEFLAMLAHELRNPLAPMRNAMEILARTGGRGPEAEAASRMLGRQIGQMVRLIDDLLDVSRISQGKIELRREAVDLGTILEQAIEAARPPCEEMEQSLDLTVPVEPLWVHGDAARLVQVFGNLLSNACKFTPRGGAIRVVVARDGDHALLHVVDNGIGIAAEQLQRIFELFAQVDASLERSQGGLGIGLTLVKRLVEMHDGTIVAASDGHGKGSTFTVRLPLVEAPAGASSVTGDRAAGGIAVDEIVTGVALSRRILVVDDNVDSADSLAILLRLSGHTIEKAFDGGAAVAACAAFRPEVVLLDLGLPVLNGYEAAQRIRAAGANPRPFLVALTGWGQEEDRRRSREAGFDAHLVKPVDPAELLRLLATGLAGDGAEA